MQQMGHYRLGLCLPKMTDRLAISGTCMNHEDGLPAPICPCHMLWVLEYAFDRRHKGSICVCK